MISIISLNMKDRYRAHIGAVHRFDIRSAHTLTLTETSIPDAAKDTACALCRPLSSPPTPDPSIEVLGADLV